MPCSTNGPGPEAVWREKTNNGDDLMTEDTQAMPQECTQVNPTQALYDQTYGLLKNMVLEILYGQKKAHTSINDVYKVLNTTSMQILKVFGRV